MVRELKPIGSVGGADDGLAHAQQQQQQQQQQQITAASAFVSRLHSGGLVGPSPSSGLPDASTLTAWVEQYNAAFNAAALFAAGRTAEPSNAAKVNNLKHWTQAGATSDYSSAHQPSPTTSYMGAEWGVWQRILPAGLGTSSYHPITHPMPAVTLGMEVKAVSQPEEVSVAAASMAAAGRTSAPLPQQAAALAGARTLVNAHVEAGPTPTPTPPLYACSRSLLQHPEEASSPPQMPKAALPKNSGGEPAATPRGNMTTAASKRKRDKDRVSSHVATEQRRRDRINESFHMLRSIVPHSDKTDKASFLAEVTEYILKLQATVAKLQGTDCEGQETLKEQAGRHRS